MKFFTDSFFTIGRAHENRGIPCQDYAHNGMLLNGIHYAAVADGCSGSTDSDIGSRALVHWMRHELRKLQCIVPGEILLPDQDVWFLKESFIRDMKSLLVTLGQPYALDSTLLFIGAHRLYKQGFVFVQGDGAVVIKERGYPTFSRVITLDWDQSMPPYMSYALDASRCREYVKIAQEGNLKGTYRDFNAETMEFEQREISSAKQVGDGGLLIPFNLNTTDYVAVFSDGIRQFGNREIFEMFHRLTRFENVGEDFVRRKCIGQLRLLKKEMVHPIDDFSMAALWIEHDEKQSASEGREKSVCDTDAVQLRS